MRASLRCAAALFVLSAVSPAQSPQSPWLDPKLTPEQRAHALVSQMTLEEKAGQSMNTAPAIPRLGVPAYDYWSEGLHGIARSGYSTLFPQAIGMAATWDAPLLGKIGDAVSTEARAKFNDAIQHNVHSIYFGLTIWSPNINIFRDPRWGRGQETYGEDPYLTGTLGLNFIEGLQGPDPLHPRVVATPKHFAVHSGPESDRHRFNVDPAPHDLYDTYLPQFREAIVDAKAASIMCAYNAIDGKPACGSDLLLKDILRGDWHFSGFVTSDCGAVDDFFEKSAHHTSPDAAHASATAVSMGTDTNCGGTYKALPAAVKAGLLKESEVDTAIERLFVARIRLGLFDPPASVPYAQLTMSQDRSAEHLALALKTSRESMVLLKNDGILPLKAGQYKHVLVAGPNAASLSALEGNYNAIPKDPQMPVDVLRSMLGAATIVYSQGAPYADGMAQPVPRTMLHPAAGDTTEGLKAEYFAGDDFTGKPVATRIDPEIDFDWNSAAPVDEERQDAFSVRWTGVIAAPKAGDYQFDMRLAHCYPCNDREHFRVLIDGKESRDFKTPGEGYRQSTTPRFVVHFDDTKPHPIAVEYSHHAPLFGGGITFEWVPPADVLQAEAVEKAKDADLVVAMVGLSPELEGEEMKINIAGFAGGDRTDIALPASQSKMIADLAATGKPMVLVLLNGSALALGDALNSSKAILEAWYPGEFGGRAIAETLLGQNNPAGRLPVTFYKSASDLPAFTDYSMSNRTYRYFAGAPEFAFGYGLSYTKFVYSNLKLSTQHLKAGENLVADVDLKNAGSREGDEVAQVYLVPPVSGNGGLSPKQQLVSFERVSLKPGQSQHVRFTLTPRQLSEVDAQGVRAVQSGEYKLVVGGDEPKDPAAPSKPVEATFSIQGTSPLPR